MNEESSSQQHFSIDNLIVDEKKQLDGIKTMRLFRKRHHVGYSNSPELYPIRAGLEPAPTIAKVIGEWVFPLHFIDIQAYERGKRVGGNKVDCDVIALSCCTIEASGDNASNNTWIRNENGDDELLLLESLMKQVGYSGTPLIWSPKLTDYFSSLNMSGSTVVNPLYEWMAAMLDRMVDLNAVVLDFYFNRKLTGKSNFQKNLDALEKYSKKKYSLNDLHALIEKKYTKPASLNPYENKVAAGFLFDYTHSQLHSDFLVQDENKIEPYIEQLLFGRTEMKGLLAEKIGEYSFVKAQQMVEWYKCWLYGK
jgi:hypothetical protein